MLTTKSVELLIDLVEIKLGAMESFDSHDRKTIRDLEACRKQLASMIRPAAGQVTESTAVAGTC